MCHLSAWHRCHTWDSRDLAEHLWRRPGGWGGHRQTSPARRAAARACSMLRARLLGRTLLPRPLSGWNLNLPRDAAGKLKSWVKHGESGFRRVLPSATAACSLGTKTCLHRSGAAGDRAALPGTTGAGGHGGARWGCGRVADLASPRSGVQTDFYSFWLHLTLASSCYRLSMLYSFPPQYFLGILKAKGTLRPPERQTLFGTWELIYAASL